MKLHIVTSTEFYNKLKYKKKRYILIERITPKSKRVGDEFMVLCNEKIYQVLTKFIFEMYAGDLENTMVSEIEKEFKLSLKEELEIKILE